MQTVYQKSINLIKEKETRAMLEFLTNADTIRAALNELDAARVQYNEAGANAKAATAEANTKLSQVDDAYVLVRTLNDNATKRMNAAEALSAKAQEVIDREAEVSAREAKLAQGEAELAKAKDELRKSLGA